MKSLKEYCNEFISDSFLIRNVLIALNHFRYQIQILSFWQHNEEKYPLLQLKFTCYKIQDTYVITFKSQIEYQDHIKFFTIFISYIVMPSDISCATFRLGQIIEISIHRKDSHYNSRNLATP